MNAKVSYGFVLGMFSWALILLLRKNGIFIPVVNSYFTDFITVPMYCYLIKLIMNFLGYSWVPDLKFVLTSTVYVSLLFEVICPRLSNVFTGDIFDVLAYGTGGLLYYIFVVSSFKMFGSEKNKKTNRF